MLRDYIMYLITFAKMSTREFFADETGEVNIIAIVILIGIAVALAILFRDQLNKLFNVLWSNITGKTGNLNNAMTP